MDILDMTTREIGEAIDDVHESKGVSTCKAHDCVKIGVVKSLRVGEQNMKMLKWIIWIAIANFISIWLKGADMKEVLKEMLQLASN